MSPCPPLVIDGVGSIIRALGRQTWSKAQVPAASGRPAVCGRKFGDGTVATAKIDRRTPNVEVIAPLSATTSESRECNLRQEERRPPNDKTCSSNCWREVTLSCWHLALIRPQQG